MKAPFTARLISRYSAVLPSVMLFILPAAITIESTWSPVNCFVYGCIYKWGSVDDVILARRIFLTDWIKCPRDLGRCSRFRCLHDVATKENGRRTMNEHASIFEQK